MAAELLPAGVASAAPAGENGVLSHLGRAPPQSPAPQVALRSARGPGPKSNGLLRPGDKISTAKRNKAQRIDHGYQVVLEGILAASFHSEVISGLLQAHRGRSFVFYLDVCFRGDAASARHPPPGGGVQRRGHAVSNAPEREINRDRSAGLGLGQAALSPGPGGASAELGEEALGVDSGVAAAGDVVGAEVTVGLVAVEHVEQ
ncbi:hypothetical protein FRACA_810020 [Frankia canadensis]|uniref:Uncharacterized protein n=1 Tax=Frankia canadensis TaxID=1836972 RepID=A0A2I2L1P5_9ACTN|nr:hypothetical protein FRACA_810020 [Frankia canadensis]SOU59119.1 hypothetical protein FRACA_810020 [Frankia canadensis]